MRYMGLDYGSKKVGIALSDEAGTMGFPKCVLTNDLELLKNVRELVAKEQVGTVVVGDSKNLDGTPNTITEAIHSFAKQLTDASGVPVVFESEVFTTQEARRGMDGTFNGIHGIVDASAAALLLTSYLSRHDNARGSEEN